MRLWARLTSRGRITLVAGLLAAVAGWLVNEVDIFWPGAVAVALVVGALVMVSWPLRGLSHTRRVPVASVPLGTPFQATISLRRSGRNGSRLLHLEDVVPPSLGPRPRFSISSPITEVGDEFSYPLTGTQRGRHLIGPLLVRSLDPFGLARNDMAFTRQTELAVTPRVHELGRLVAGAAGASAESTTSNAGLVGQDDVLVRDYRRGDDVRRVHWRSTARVGSLMVRREEQAWQPTTRIMIDNRRSSHAGHGNTSSFEWAVSAAASIGLSLLSHGSTLEVSDTDGPILGSDQDQVIRAQQLLEALTDITLTRADSLSVAMPGGHGRHQGESVLAILGRLDASDVAMLLDTRPGTGSADALILDVDTFEGGRPSPEQARYARVLVEHGWSVVVVDAAMDVPHAWRQLRPGAGAAA